MTKKKVSNPRLWTRTITLDITSAVSMEKPLIDRIIMVYFSLTRNSRQRQLKRLYVPVGRSVIRIRHSSQIPMHRMLRDTLTALIICHKFCYTEGFDRSPYLASARLSALSYITRKKLRKYSLSALLMLLSSIMNRQPLIMFLFGSRINVSYTPKFQD